MFKRILGIGTVVIIATIGLSGCGKATTGSQSKTITIAKAAQAKTPRVWYTVSGGDSTKPGKNVNEQLVNGVYVTKNGRAVGYIFNQVSFDKFAGKNISDIQATATKYDKAAFENTIHNLTSNAKENNDKKALNVYKNAQYKAPSWKPINIHIDNSEKGKPIKFEDMIIKSYEFTSGYETGDQPIAERRNNNILGGNGDEIMVNKIAKNPVKIGNINYLYFIFSDDGGQTHQFLLTKAPSENTKLQFDKLGTKGVTKVND